MAGAQASDLLARLHAVGAPTASATPGGVGYRGLIVRCAADVWRVGGGVIEHDGRRSRDDGVEAALLATLPDGLRRRFGAVLPRDAR